MRTRTRKFIAWAVAALVGIAVIPMAASAVDINRLPQVQFQGQTGDQLGDSIADGGCDLNGDGYTDVVGGAWGWALTPGSTGLQGATYLMFGGPEPTGGDLTSLATDSVLIKGAHPDDMTGWTVGCADINGDGFGDAIIGADHIDRAYVVYGAADLAKEKVLDLSSLGEHGFVIERDPSLFRQGLGHTVAGLGDLDGDGKEDFAIGASEVSTLGRSSNGRIYVFKGRSGTSTLTAGNPNDLLMTIDGAMDSERLASERGGISAVGDVNGDGVPDIAFGSAFTQPWGTSVVQSGRVYVVSGKVRGPLDLAKPLGSKGFIVNGPNLNRDRAGTAVAGRVDVNGDGLNDLIIGADGQSNATTGPRNGRAYVVFGSPFNEDVNLGSLAASARGFVVEGANQDDRVGYSVAGIHDLDGDGKDEVAVGAYRRTGWAGTYQGAVYLLNGKSDSDPIDLASLTADQGSILVGGDAGDEFGRQVTNIGDFDGNGSDDLAVGADGAIPYGRVAALGASAGEITVLLTPDPVVEETPQTQSTTQSKLNQSSTAAVKLAQKKQAKAKAKAKAKARKKQAAKRRAALKRKLAAKKKATARRAAK